MNDYLARNEISAVDGRAARPAAPISSLAAVASRPAGTNDQASPPAESGQPAAAASLDSEVAGVTEYAKIHARIADILATMRSAGAPSVDDAASAIQAMMPAPVILVPLPPASREAVEHAAVLAKKIAEQASHAHFAQAHVKRGTVDHILSAVA